MQKIENFPHEVGDHTYFASDCLPRVEFPHETSKLKIGKFCSIGRNLKVYLSGEHPINSLTTYPLFMLSEELRPFWGGPFRSRGDVEICNDVWIGDDVTIMSGCRIGDGAVIGTGSVLRENVPSYAVAYGNPCKVIRMRYKEPDLSKIRWLRWWDWPDELIIQAGKILQTGNVNDLDTFYIEHIATLA